MIKSGDIFFLKNEKGIVNHCGIVFEVTNKNVYTIENDGFKNSYKILNGILSNDKMHVEIYRMKKLPSSEFLNSIDTSFKLKNVFSKNKSSKMVLYFIKDNISEEFQDVSETSMQNLYKIVSCSSKFAVVLKKNGT